MHLLRRRPVREESETRAWVYWGPGNHRGIGGAVEDFPVRERLRFRFEATFTNALNHTNFAPPASDISSPSTFGVLQSAQTAGQGGNRTGQLALRMDF